MYSSIRSIPNEENHQKSDLVLEKNGRYIRFADEVTQQILQPVSSDNKFSLHQTLMVISHDKKDHAATIYRGVKTTLEHSIINWDIIGLQTMNSTVPQPAIFRFIRSSSVIIAATKAGIIRQSTLMRSITVGLIILTGIMGAGLIMVFPADPVISFLLLPELLKGTWYGLSFPLLALAVVSIELLIFSLLSGYVRMRSPRLHKIIADHLHTSTATQTADPAFVAAIKEQFLQLPMPMAILIEDMQCLDIFSKNVLMSILSDKECTTIGKILWIICLKNGNKFHAVSSHSFEKSVPFPGMIDHHYFFVDHLPKGKKAATGRYPILAA
jgi:hypothetical protein